MVNETKINTLTFMSNHLSNYSLAGYDEIVTQALEVHLQQYNHFELLKQGLSIVLLSTTFEVYNKPKRGEKLTAKMFDGGITGPILRENIEVYRDDKMVINSAFFFALIDINKRKIVKNIADYFPAKPEKAHILEATSRCERGLDGILVDEIVIKPSHIDALNHCNNQRYYEFIYDCLSEKQRSMNEFNMVEMFYINEIKVNEKLRIFKKEEENIVYFYGLKDNDEVSFKAVLHFELDEK